MVLEGEQKYQNSIVAQELRSLQRTVYVDEAMKLCQVRIRDAMYAKDKGTWEQRDILSCSKNEDQQVVY